MKLVLSLFPGIGMLDVAFELEGNVVVRGPDPIWGGDIRRFHPPKGKFDGIIGGLLDHCPFTAEGKLKAVANGVPIPMGRAIARAIKEAIAQ